MVTCIVMANELTGFNLNVPLSVMMIGKRLSLNKVKSATDITKK
jgi:hypothetical protein